MLKTHNELRGIQFQNQQQHYCNHPCYLKLVKKLGLFRACRTEGNRIIIVVSGGPIVEFAGGFDENNDDNVRGRA